MIEIFPYRQELINIQKNLDKKCFVPIWSEIIADLETPVSAFHKVCKDNKYSYLLESAEGEDNIGRYSFIGTNPLFLIRSEDKQAQLLDFLTGKILKEQENPYNLLQDFLDEYDSKETLFAYSPSAVGYFSYDSIIHIEPRLKKFYEKPEKIEKCESFPLAYLMVPETVMVFDHLKHKIYIVNNVLIDKNSEIDLLISNSKAKISSVLSQIKGKHNLSPITLSQKTAASEFTSNLTKQEWTDALNKAKEYILAGDIFQVVLSQRFCTDRKDKDPFSLYRALRSINPSPYLYYLNFDDFQIIGSSPEMMVKCSKDGIAETRPIAGTRHRGNNAEEDNFLKEELINDPKERAEHIMLVDLARNDLGRVCEYGSVKVTKLMEIENFSHVMHIVSDVKGKLKNEFSSIDLLKACFPAGTLSGAPKIRAMEIIYELEKSARGPYGGCIGYFGFDGEMNTSITIRTMLVRSNKVFVQAGAGIVADSEPDFEYQETQNKAAALIQAVEKLEELS
jgi:anthranilate synthase component I